MKRPRRKTNLELDVKAYAELKAQAKKLGAVLVRNVTVAELLNNAMRAEIERVKQEIKEASR